MRWICKISSALFVSVAMAASSSASVVRTDLLSEMPQILSGAQTRASRGDLPMANAYLDLILMSKPVRISVSFDSKSAARRAECVQSIREAVWKWEKALDNQVRFVFISDASRAEVKVRFTSNLGFKGNDTAGHCDYVREILGTNARVRATMHVLTELPGGTQMGLPQMRHTGMHELGHVLGLEDNPTPGALMGPLVPSRPVNEIDPVEIENLSDLRLQAMVARQEIQQRVYAMRR